MRFESKSDRRLVKRRTIGLGFLACLVLLSQAECVWADDFSDGKSLFQAKQYAPAANKLLKAVKNAPAHAAESYYMLGCCYYKLNRPTEAKGLFRTVASNFPASKEAKLAAIMIARLDPQSAPQSSGGGVSAASVVRGLSPQMDSELASLPDQNTIYFKTAGSGHMEVTAYLDGRPIPCWFDTGASAHFGKNHLAAAGIPAPRGAPSGQTSGWAGNAVPVWRDMSNLRIGGMTRKVPITVEENMDLMPLVGQEFLRGYQYEIENGRDGGGIIRMKKTSTSSGGSSSKNFSSLYDVPCTTEHSRDYVLMEVEGKKLTVLLDTGAAASMFAPSDLAKIGVRIDQDAPTAMMSGVGGSLAVKVVPLRLRLGPIDRTINVNVGGNAGSAVGQDFLGSKRFTIDRENKLLRFFH